jgi:predicted nucleic-acid-binding protein
MNVTVDTNVLVRAVMGDDPAQTRQAIELLKAADRIAVPVTALCELAWVLRSVYRLGASRIALAIEQLVQADTVVTDRAAASAGLECLKAGGDFADGVIAHQGRWLGGETFISFDRGAVDLVRSQGHPARLASQRPRP